MTFTLEFELVELLLLLGYLIFGWRLRRQQPTTFYWCLTCALALAFDIFVLKGAKPWWRVYVLNAPFWLGLVFIYEKIVKQLALWVLRKCVVLVTLLLR